MHGALYETRTYRDYGPAGRFVTFRVVVETSDLYVKAHEDLRWETERLLRRFRGQVEQAIAQRPEFLRSMKPIDERESAAEIVARMIAAGKKAGTGPMAAVAGAIAQFVGQDLLRKTPEVVIENGGDIFMKVDHPLVVGLFAGDSPFSGRLGLSVAPSPLPLGVCTSSASVGPSLSRGRADAATVVSRDTALADAVATQLGNRVRQPEDLEAALEWAIQIPGVMGALVVMGESLGVRGEIELVPLPAQETEVN